MTCQTQWKLTTLGHTPSLTISVIYSAIFYLFVSNIRVKKSVMPSFAQDNDQHEEILGYRKEDSTINNLS